MRNVGIPPVYTHTDIHTHICSSWMRLYNVKKKTGSTNNIQRMKHPVNIWTKVSNHLFRIKPILFSSGSVIFIKCCTTFTVIKILLLLTTTMMMMMLWPMFASQILIRHEGCKRNIYFSEHIQLHLIYCSRWNDLPCTNDVIKVESITRPYKHFNNVSFFFFFSFRFHFIFSLGLMLWLCFYFLSFPFQRRCCQRRFLMRTIYFLASFLLFFFLSEYYIHMM